MNIGRLVAGDSGATARTALLTHARRAVAAPEARITKLMHAMLGDPGPVPAAVSRKVHELEKRLTVKQREVERLERGLVVKTNVTPTAVQEWSALVDGVLAFDYETRMKARQLFPDSFSKIAIYLRGFMSTEDDDDWTAARWQARQHPHVHYRPVRRHVDHSS